MLGSGGTDATGHFVDANGLGIGLSRPLKENEQIYPIDICITPQLVGPTVTVALRALAPAMSPFMTLTLVGVLSGFGFWKLTGARRAT